jgi:hypothetical protein
VKLEERSLVGLKAASLGLTILIIGLSAAWLRLTARDVAGTFVQEQEPVVPFDVGCFFVANDLETDVCFQEPGVYAVYLSETSREQLVGNVNLVAAEVPAYTAEEIAAIRSSPLAMKFIRMQLGCNVSGGSYRSNEAEPTLRRNARHLTRQGSHRIIRGYGFLFQNFLKSFTVSGECPE